MEQKKNQTAKKAPQKKKMSSKSKWKRRGRIAVVCMPVVVVAVLLGLLLGATVFFKVESYSVSGTKKYTAEQVWQASGLKTGKSMFASDLDEAEENITVRLPYIESVSIKRKLPHTLTFTAVESKVSLAVQVNGEWMLLNSSGKVLEKLGENEPPENVMRLKIPETAKCELGHVLEFETKEDEPSPTEICKNLMKAIDETALKGKITMIDVSNPEDVTVVYDSRIRLHIGAPTDLATKLGLAAGAVSNEDKINPEQTGELNLTVLQEAYFRPDNSKKENEQKQQKETEPAASESED